MCFRKAEVKSSVQPVASSVIVAIRGGQEVWETQFILAFMLRRRQTHLVPNAARLVCASVALTSAKASRELRVLCRRQTQETWRQEVQLLCSSALPSQALCASVVISVK